MPTAVRLPEHVATRADLDALLAATTNYEERLPARPGDRAFDLARMRDLLAALGEPQRGPLTVHVAGSKGKGTLCRLVAAGLEAAGAGRGPVGLYLSPHLVDLAERVQVDGRPVADAALCAAADALLPYLRAARGTPAAPTFFEVMTAVAWQAFRAAGARAVVLETGLGGRLDATNVCAPAATAITSIELEHQQVLGSTLEAIAAEKAGILKPGVACVTTAAGAALDVIAARARAVGAPLLVAGAAFRAEGARTGPGRRLHVGVGLEGRDAEPFEVPLAGLHHAPAVAAAVALLRGLGVAPAEVRAGLARVAVPGVLEPVEDDPLVLVDGAHTPGSARATRAALWACWPGRPVVLLAGVLAEKDARGVLAGLAQDVAAVVLTRAPSPRALEPGALAACLPAGAPAPALEPDPAAALAGARASVPPGGLVLAAGSVYLAGAVKRLCAARA